MGLSGEDHSKQREQEEQRPEEGTGPGKAHRTGVGSKGKVVSLRRNEGQNAEATGKVVFLQVPGSDSGVLGTKGDKIQLSF